MNDRSISDDDLCSACRHCDYHPGEQSTCRLSWPGKVNPDGYVVECERFEKGNQDES